MGFDTRLWGGRRGWFNRLVVFVTDESDGAFFVFLS